MALTTYAELQASILDWALRPDLSAVVPDFITLCEKRMLRDYRVRKLIRTDPFTVDAETETVPSDFQELDALYLDGDNSRYGELEVVGAGELAEYQRLYGPTGVPRVVAIVDGNFVFAPVPDQAYDMVASYYAGFDVLADDNTSNWVLANHPDAYLFGSLMYLAPYMNEDNRIQVWSGAYETAVEEIHQAQQREQYSGNLVSRVSHPIP